MSISFLVQFRMKAEKDAALTLDRAVKAVAQNSKDVLEDIRSGAERASWYSACFFEKYAEDCTQLRNEDTRFVKALFELYKRHDILTEMMTMFIDAELKKSNITQIQLLDKKLSTLLAGYQSAKFTNMAVAASIAIFITNAQGFKNSVLNNVNRHAIKIVTALSFYGKVQHAAREARRLQLFYPALYMAFYHENIEMLYFLISEKVDYALRYATGLRGEERFIHIIKNLAS